MNNKLRIWAVTILLGGVLLGAFTHNLFHSSLKHASSVRERTSKLQTQQSENTPALFVRKNAMIRLEDIGPGGSYGSLSGLGKLRAVMNYLHKVHVPFQISLIPNWISRNSNGTWYHRNIGEGSTDPFVEKFDHVLQEAQTQGALIGMEGYSHQYGDENLKDRNEDSAIGAEFNVPLSPETATIAYAAKRFSLSLAAMQKADLQPAFWASPHFRDTLAQERLFRSEIGILYQPDTFLAYRRRTIVYEDSINPYGTTTLGSVYVPMPLGYINKRKSPKLMLQLAERNWGIASLYFHPFLEFPHLVPVMGADGKPELQDGIPLYRYNDDQTPLHQVVQGFRNAGYRWISLGDSVPFTPAQRIILPKGTQTSLLLDKNNGAQLFALTGNLAFLLPEPYTLPRNQTQPQPINWGNVSFTAKQDEAVMLDVTGDKVPDLVIYNKENGKVTAYPNNGTEFLSARSFGTLPAGLSSIHAIQFHGGPALLGVSSRGLSVVIPSTFTRQWKPAIQRFPPLPQAADIWASPLESGGDDALFLYQPTKGIVTIFPNLDAWHSIAVAVKAPFVGSQIQAASGDFNGDGLTDLVLFDPKSGLWEILRNQENQRLIPLDFRYGPWGKGMTKHVITGDFDGNGKADIALYDSGLNVIDISLSDQPK